MPLGWASMEAPPWFELLNSNKTFRLLFFPFNFIKISCPSVKSTSIFSLRRWPFGPKHPTSLGKIRHQLAGSAGRRYK